MKKIEKLLITPILWLYIGIFVGGLSGIVFALVGGFYIFFIVMFGAWAIGLYRTIYFAFNYKESPACHEVSKRDIFRRRILIAVAYFFTFYSVAGKYLDPYEWNNPYTYQQWGEATDMYFSRDREVVVPRTIIEYRKAKGHYYGLRLSVDNYKCSPSSPGGGPRFTNRRWYFILPIEEDEAIEFQDKDEFEAELKARIPGRIRKLNYSLFDKKYEHYSSLDKRRDNRRNKKGEKGTANCVITRGQ